MIRGATREIAWNPAGFKDAKPEEIFVPSQIDLRNGHVTALGNWEKRPGYSQKWATNSGRPIDLLIPSAPESAAYGVTEDGSVFLLAPTVKEYTGRKLNGPYRPTWANHEGVLVLCDGGNPVKISAGDASLLAGGPPSARFVDTLDTYVLMAGGDQFNWSAAGNSASWPAANFNNVISDGEKIVMMKVANRDIFFFKDYSIEIWVDIGGSTVFARKAFINVVDKTHRQGAGIIGDSVVRANNTFYFFCDGDFYLLEGYSPRVISKPYRQELDKLVNYTDLYGFDFRKESLIRWFARTDGKCFVYDYARNFFSEDAAWMEGGWQKLPINSYMELDGKQYFGDTEPTGKVYQWRQDDLTDNGQEIRVYRRLAVPLSGDGRQARVNRLRFRVKRGVATATETNPKLSVRWRFDQGGYSDFEELDLGSAGKNDPYLDLHGLGVGAEMELEVTETDAVDHLLSRAYLTVEPLGV